MAGIKGLNALFSGKQIANVFDKFQKDVHDKTLQTLQYMGEQFVNNARLSGNYTDRTGNLRSSIGYIILLNGRTIKNNFQGKEDGVSEGKKIAEEVALQYPKGFVLIGVAGMEYAAYVEAKGFDVITGSAPNSNDLEGFFNEV